MKTFVPITGCTFHSPLGSSLSALTDQLVSGTSALSFDHRFSEWTAAPLCELNDGEVGAFKGAAAFMPGGASAVHGAGANELLVNMARDVLVRLLDGSGILSRVPAQKIGIYMGTSTAGVERMLAPSQAWDAEKGTDPAAFFNWTHQHGLLESHLRHEFGLSGPGCTFATACSSAALAIAEAGRAVGSGVVDAAIAGGFDVLSLMTILGFSAMQILSARGCRPFGADADGISLGEGGALLLLESPRLPGVAARSIATLSGWGASSDGHHIAQPHPEGRGMSQAMEAALQCAALQPQHISYVNAHGTGTQHNDAAESLALAHVFKGGDVPISSTKALHGHLLGAAGALEAVVCLAALQSQRAFAGASASDGGLRPLAGGLKHATGEPGRLDYVLSNSFGFGGSNASLIFGRVPFGREGV